MLIALGYNQPVNIVAHVIEQMMQYSPTAGFENARELWLRAKSARPAENAGVLSADTDWQLKNENRVQILLHSAKTGTGKSRPLMVSKIYRMPPALAWRSLGMTSRAEREYDALCHAFGKGLPVVRPLGWSDSRFLGLLRYSQLSMEFTQGESLLEFMRCEAMDHEKTATVITRLGQLLAGLHGAGIAWGTARLRNVMVLTGSRVCAYDFPYASILDRNICGTPAAIRDLQAISTDPNFPLSRQLRTVLFTAYAQSTDKEFSAISQQVDQSVKMNRLGGRILERTKLVFQGRTVKDGRHS